MEPKKFNPYIIIIIVLLLIVAGLVYSKWGGGIFSSLTRESEQSKSDTIVDIDTKISGGDIVIGNDDALVTIVEYYSYFCGYCKSFHDETYPKIIENYVTTGKVKYVFRVSPFRNEDIILGAAILCANEQDKFLEYHNEVFEKIGNIQEANDLKILAKDIDLNENEFNQCFDSQKYASKVEEWMNQADADFEAVGVPENERGTPAFFINGELILGAHPYEKFVEIIEKKLGE